MSEPKSCPECGLWAPCSTCARPVRTLAVVEAPADIVAAQDAMLRTEREARLRTALSYIANGKCQSITDAEEVAQVTLAQDGWLP